MRRSDCTSGADFFKALQQFMLGIGAFVAGWVSYGTYIGLHTTAQWRLPLGLQMVPAIGLGTHYPRPQEELWPDRTKGL
jgi:hypothetical protein